MWSPYQGKRKLSFMMREERDLLVMGKLIERFQQGEMDVEVRQVHEKTVFQDVEDVKIVLTTDPWDIGRLDLIRWHGMMIYVEDVSHVVDWTDTKMKFVKSYMDLMIFANLDSLDACCGSLRYHRDRARAVGWLLLDDMPAEKRRLVKGPNSYLADGCVTDRIFGIVTHFVSTGKVVDPS